MERTEEDTNMLRAEVPKLLKGGRTCNVEARGVNSTTRLGSG